MTTPASAFRIPRGTPIAVVAPSHAFDRDRLARGISIARERGHVLHLLPDLLQPHRYFASPAPQRLAHLHEALTSPDFGAVWIARGGSGLTQLLPMLRIEGPPRPVIGFSDVSALHAALVRANFPAIHGPVLHSLPQTDAASLDHLFRHLDGQPTAPLDGSSWIPGAARGRIVGGNLTVLAALCGTPHQLDAKGAILILEDIGEAPYRVDRALTQLRNSGVFEGVVGLAIGEMVGCHPQDTTWTLRDAFMEHLEPLGVPVLGELPFGHGSANRALPLGGSAQISGDQLSLF